MTGRKGGKPFNAIHPATIAAWAAIVAAGHLLPTIPVLGAGGTFSLTAALSPLSGILFGPVAGALCSAAGGFIGSLIAPHTAWLGMGTFIIGTATAFTSGCIARGRWPLVSINRSGHFIINGGIIIYIIGVILWFTQETGRDVILFPAVFYSLGFAALIAGSFLGGKAAARNGNLIKFITIWLCAFGGLIGGATIGNFFSLVLLKLPKEMWIYLTAVAPLERALFALGAALIGVPLLSGLPKIGIPVGNQDDDTVPFRGTADGEQPLPSENENPGRGNA